MLAAALSISWTLLAAVTPADTAAQLLTRAEQTGFAETGRYEDTLELCHRLEKASPWIRVASVSTAPGRGTATA